MDPYFPFRATRQDSQSELAAERLNLAYCEMTGLMALTSLTSNDRQPASRNRKGKQPVARARTLDLGIQVERVSEFIIDRLDLVSALSLSPDWRQLTEDLTHRTTSHIECPGTRSRLFFQQSGRC